MSSHTKRALLAASLAATLGLATLALPAQAAPAGESRTARGVVVDANGARHTRYERTLQGLRVIGGDYVEHADATGRAVDRTGHRPDALKLKGQAAKVAQGAAISAALADAAASGAKVSASGAEQVWYNGDDGVVPAFDVLVIGTAADGTPVRSHYYVDGVSGAVLTVDAEIKAGTGVGFLDGTVTIGTTAATGGYQLKDSLGHAVYDLNGATSGTGTLMTDTDDRWGDGTSNLATTAGRQSAAVDAQFGAQKTYNYFLATFGRKGIWNTGKGAPSRVHYGNGYVNAFWDGTQMTYGDGAGNLKPLTELDVAGHEMTHGITANTAKLVYKGEPGGLNEATSDIFGTAVEWYVNSPVDTPDYLLGEKLNLTPNGAFRFMDRPSRDGYSYDCWTQYMYRIDVHFSSGPLNHWFYLVSEGSGAKTINGVAYNSPTCNSSVVTGVGRAVAEKVWYRALTVYLTSTSNYAAAREATIRSAKDLYGAGSAQCKTVEAAMKAIDVPAGTQTC